MAEYRAGDRVRVVASEDIPDLIGWLGTVTGHDAPFVLVLLDDAGRDDGLSDLFYPHEIEKA